MVLSGFLCLSIYPLLKAGRQLVRTCGSLLARGQGHHLCGVVWVENFELFSRNFSKLGCVHINVGVIAS